MQGGSDALERDDLEALVKRAQEGDSRSLAAIYEQFYDRIFRYVSFKTGNPTDAEDITEDVFLRMLVSISSFKWQGNPFSSWLFRIAHNLIVDHFRKKSRQKHMPLEETTGVVETASPDMDSELDIKLSIGKVYQSMNGLTELQKEVITLRFAGGLSVMETARAVGKKENAVKALQHAGIKNLRRILVNKGAAERAMPVRSGEVADG